MKMLDGDICNVRLDWRRRRKGPRGVRLVFGFFTPEKHCED